MKLYRYVIAALFVLATTSPSQGDNTPKYKGEIRPLEQHVLVRYRPYPNSPVMQTQTVSTHNSFSHIKMTGFSKVVAEGAFLIDLLQKYGESLLTRV